MRARLHGRTSTCKPARANACAHQTDGRAGGRADGRAGGRTGGRAGGRTEMETMDGRTDGRTGAWTDGWTHARTYRWTHARTHGRTGARSITDEFASCWSPNRTLIGTATTGPRCNQAWLSWNRTPCARTRVRTRVHARAHARTQSYLRMQACTHARIFTVQSDGSMGIAKDRRGEASWRSGQAGGPFGNPLW